MRNGSPISWGTALVLAACLGLGISAGRAMAFPEALSPFTVTTFTPDGQINEFINYFGDDQAYFIVDPTQNTDFGAIKVGATLTRGVLVVRDNSPAPGLSNAAGLTGFRDPPGSSHGIPLPTGFNIGRVFASYNPAAYDHEGAYFLAMDITAPAALDSISGTQPIAFDIDGDGSRLTQTEINPGVVSESPKSLSLPDNYVFDLDSDRDGTADVAVTIGERRNTVPFGGIAIDPGGVPQVINGVTVRRWVIFDDLSGSLPGSPQLQALFFLDANDDGVINYLDFGVDDDVELVIRHVDLLPNAIDPACGRFRYVADSFDDVALGGGAEERVHLDAQFAAPDLEVTKEGRCVGEADSAFRQGVMAAPGSQVEFRIKVANWGNRDLDVTVQDALTCTPPATAALVPSSCQVMQAPKDFPAAQFCDDFESALNAPTSVPVSIGVLEASDPCAVGLGQQLVFTFRVMLGAPADGSALCDQAVDCRNGVSAMGTTLVDPILAPDPPSLDSPDGDAEEEDCNNAVCCGAIPGCLPADGLGDVADEFTLTVSDLADVIDTAREAAAMDDDNIAEVEIKCRGVRLTKEARLLPGGPFHTGLDKLQLPPAPLELEYRYTAANPGEIGEQVTISDAALCGDIATLQTSLPGSVVFVNCPLCTGATPGQIAATVPAGGAFASSCVIRFVTQAGLTEFLRLDDARPACRAEDAPGQADETCYRNCATLRANAVNTGQICPAGETVSSSFSTVCHSACDLDLVKQVRCLNNCINDSPTSSFVDTLTASPGSCVEFQTTMTNGGDDPLCALRVTDTLSPQPGQIVFEDSVRFRIGAVNCTTPAGFNVNGTPFVFDPSARCGLPNLAPGQALTLTFDASIPVNADPTVSPINTLTAEAATVCPAGVPAFSCAGTADAMVDVLDLGLVCQSKEWAFLWDQNGDCEPDSPFSAFSSITDLRNKVFPVLLRMRLRAVNTGDLSLNVTATDPTLAACVASTPGVSFSQTPACQLGTSMLVAPDAVGQWFCNIRVETADAMRALDACDGTIDGMFSNSFAVSGTVASPPPNLCLPAGTVVAGTGVCSAVILVPPECDISLTKQVKCQDEADAEYAAAAEALPGSRLIYRLEVRNTSALVKIPQLCIRDVLSCHDWLVPGSVHAAINGANVEACVASDFAAALVSSARDCYTFAACRPAAPWIAPGETLTIVFEVRVPVGFSAFGFNPDCTNNVTIDAYSEVCPTSPPAADACDSAVAAARVNVGAPQIECHKVVCPDFDGNGACDGAFTANLTVAASVDYPFALIYRFIINNVGESPLTNVKVCDLPLLTAASGAGLTIGTCNLLAPPDGCSADLQLGPGQSAIYNCSVVVPSYAAWTAFAAADSDMDSGCHTNHASSAGSTDVINVCDAGASANPASDSCTARVCVGSPPTGACCLANECRIATEEECLAGGALYVGDESECTGDTDGDGVDEICEEPIPTVSEWGLFIMGLLLLAAGKLYFGRRPAIAYPRTAGGGSTTRLLSIGKLPLCPPIFRRALGFVAALAAIGFAAGYLVTGSIDPVDIGGTICSGPILAYLIHLWMLPYGA